MYKFLLSVAVSLALGGLSHTALAATNINSCGTISQQGTYVLTQDLTVSGNCFVINASHVILDLGGHTVKGSDDGIGVTTGNTYHPADFGRGGISVRNGTLADFGYGVKLDGYGIFGVRVENLRIERSSITVGRGAVVRNNTVTGGAGLFAGIGAYIVGNTVTDNNAGIFAGKASFIGTNTVIRNTNMGIRAGDWDNNVSRVAFNEVNHNGHDGMTIKCPADVLQNDVWFNNRNNNGGIPILLIGSGCYVNNNTAF